MKKVFFLLGAIALMSFSSPSDAMDVDKDGPGNCCTVNIVIEGEEIPLVTVCNGNVSTLENCAAAQAIVDRMLQL